MQTTNFINLAVAAPVASNLEPSPHTGDIDMVKHVRQPTLFINQAHFELSSRITCLKCWLDVTKLQARQKGWIKPDSTTRLTLQT